MGLLRDSPVTEDDGAEPSVGSMAMASHPAPDVPSRRHRAVVEASHPVRHVLLDSMSLRSAIEGRDLLARDALITKVGFVAQMTLGRDHPDVEPAASEALEIVWRKFSEFKDGGAATAAT
jgi:hypothetical protein